MSKSDYTRVQLIKALERILSHNTERISPEQKLSVRAVEQEAGLGNGSAHYYKDIVAKIHEEANQLRLKSQSQHSTQDAALVAKLRDSLKTEKRLKEKYRMEIIHLRKQLSQLAAQHNSMTLQFQNYATKVNELENKIPKITTSIELKPS